MAEAKEFYVATGFHRVVLRQSVLCRDPVGQGKDTSCCDIGFYVAIELDRLGVLCRDKLFLCRDRVGNGGEVLCHEKIFYVAIECG